MQKKAKEEKVNENQMRQVKNKQPDSKEDSTIC